MLEWLEPDWVLDMWSCQLARGGLRRPTIELTVAPVLREACHFSAGITLSHELLVSAKCFAAFWGDEPVAFSSWIHRMTRNRRAHDMREHSTVVLPDFRGIGIGNRLSELCASIFTGAGGPVFSTTSHPRMVHYRNESPHWRTERFGMVASTGNTGMLSRKRQGKASPYELARLATQEKTGRRALDSCGRVTGGFQYVGAPMERTAAEAMLVAQPMIFGDSNCDIILSLIPADGALRSANNIAARAGLSRRG